MLAIPNLTRNGDFYYDFKQHPRNIKGMSADGGYCVMKFKEGAVNTNDAVLRGLYEQAASQHLNHYNTLLNILNGK
mgnify:CR=1 FL=1